MRRAAQVDRNHREIVARFRALGCSVTHTAGVGDGFPDLVVGCSGKTLLVEVKDGRLPPSRRELTSAQRLFRAKWRGPPVHLVLCPEDVNEICSIARRL